MSLELEDEIVRLSIFFKLGFNDTQLKRILDKIEDFEIIGEKIESKVGDIQFGPVLLKIGNLSVDDNIYDFKYNHERFLLNIEGKLDNMHIVLEKTISAFKENYQIEKICRFIEFYLSGLIIEPNLSLQLSKKIKVDKTQEIEKIFNHSLIPSSLEFRSSIEPTNDNYFSINLSPETLSSSGRLYLKIIKRFDSDFSEMAVFLQSLVTLNEKLLNWLVDSN